MSKYVVFIGGPTASGKTSLAIQLAKIYDSQIISADSRQLYREISIGTAKPSVAERDGINHHLIDFISINDHYSAGQFERDALDLIQRLHIHRDIIIVVGGTGLYHRSIYQGLNRYPNVAQSTIHYYNQLLSTHGIAYLQDELKRKDPLYADQVDLSNPHRLIRALSVIKTSDQTFSSFQLLDTQERPFVSIKLAIDIDRKQLYQRINQRVDQMIATGLVAEARTVYPLRHLKSLHTVGYTELFKYFDGEWDKPTAIEKIKQHTRNYAKRQMTWFKNQDNWTPIADIMSAQATIDRIISQK